jgi:hypothetical protein
MRKLLITILLAGAASSPAFAAQDEDHDSPRHWRGDRPVQNVQPPQQQNRDDRQQAHEERQQVQQEVRAERFTGGNFNHGDQPRADRPGLPPQPTPGAQQADSGRRGGWDRSRFGRGDYNAPGVDQRRTYDRANRQGSPTWTDNRYSGDRSNWQQRSGTWNGSTDQNRQRQAWQQQQRVRDGNRWVSGGWNRDWRNDRRYDWRNYRDRHRSVFRLGIYYDPFGYGYRPFNIGYRLQPSYFGQNYWIDPALYGLPFPPPGTAWVRYWNDALLVDIYTGEVIDAVHNFFW